MTFVIEEYTSYKQSIPAALDQIAADRVIKEQTSILIKPNLINSSPHPVTTPPECCEAIIRYIKQHSRAEIVIAEGCGDSVLETDDVFRELEYDRLAEEYQVNLLDLNHAPTVRKKNPSRPVFPEMILPEIAFTHFIISVPVLKAHSLAEITGSLKNMMGFAPPRHYSGRFGSWKKAAFHTDMQRSIMDLCSYISPDLSVMDASIGLADFHLGGNHCSPPVNKIIAGFDPYKVDRAAAELLGFNWREIPHLR